MKYRLEAVFLFFANSIGSRNLIVRFDGGFRTKESFSAGGGVSCEHIDFEGLSHRGRCVGSYYFGANCRDSLVSEYQSLIEGLYYIQHNILPDKSHAMQSITLIGDSEITVSRVSKFSTLSKDCYINNHHNLAVALLDISQQRFANVSLLHEVRERNQVSDFLANLALDHRATTIYGADPVTKTSTCSYRYHGLICARVVGIISPLSTIHTSTALKASDFNVELNAEGCRLPIDTNERDTTYVKNSLRTGLLGQAQSNPKTVSTACLHISYPHKAILFHNDDAVQMVSARSAQKYIMGTETTAETIVERGGATLHATSADSNVKDAIEEGGDGCTLTVGGHYFNMPLLRGSIRLRYSDITAFEQPHHVTTDKIKANAHNCVDDRTDASYEAWDANELWHTVAIPVYNLTSATGLKLTLNISLIPLPSPEVLPTNGSGTVSVQSQLSEQSAPLDDIEEPNWTEIQSSSVLQNRHDNRRDVIDNISNFNNLHELSHESVDATVDRVGNNAANCVASPPLHRYDYLHRLLFCRRPVQQTFHPLRIHWGAIDSLRHRSAPTLGEKREPWSIHRKAGSHSHECADAFMVSGNVILTQLTHNTAHTQHNFLNFPLDYISYVSLSSVQPLCQLFVAFPLTPVLCLASIEHNSLCFALLLFLSCRHF